LTLRSLLYIINERVKGLIIFLYSKHLFTNFRYAMMLEVALLTQVVISAEYVRF